MPVIKSAESPSFSAFSMNDIEAEAAALLEGAKRRAAAILERARQEADEQRQTGYDAGLVAGREQGHIEGFQAGTAEGKAQAFTEHEQKLVALADTLDAILRSFNADRAALAARSQGEVTALAIAIADRICKRAAELNPEVCRVNVTAALRLVMKSQDVKLHVHPKDHDDIKTLLPAIQRKWPALTHIELIEDPEIIRGGCRVLTEGGLIDADLQTQLDRVAADLVPA